MAHNFLNREDVYEEVSSVDVKTLDLTTLTDVKDIIAKFASDCDFAPKETTMVFDSEIGEISIDDDLPPSFDYDFEEAQEELMRARESPTL